MEIRLLGEQIGAEITGIDVKAMDDATWEKVYGTWLQHNVIIVRDQELGIEDFYNYSLRFGPVEAHPSKSTRHPDYPKITMLGVGKFDEDGRLNMAVYGRGADSFHTDGAYDQDRVYDDVAGHSAEAAVVVPPRATAVLSPSAETDPTQRDRHIQAIAEQGRMGRQKTSGYNARAGAEGAMSRYKRIIGDTLRSHTRLTQEVETRIAVTVLNRMLDLGRPESLRAA